jgi:uncharacterized ion transporter superfamily protein YfcC
MTRKASFPHPMVIMLAFVVLATISTYVIPGGKFERKLDPNTQREVVIPGSYSQSESAPVGFWDMLVKIPEGIIAGADVVVLILILGGAFFIVDKTGAFQAGLEFLVHRFEKATSLLLAMLGLVFGAAGALNGLQEEIIAMVPVLMILARNVGYTPLSVIAISLGSAIIGGSFGPSNPFSVLIAQKVAGVDVFSGGMFRMFFLALALAFWIIYFVRTGKEKANPFASSQTKSTKLAGFHQLILLLVASTFTIMILGLSRWNWGYNEMSAVFFAMGLLVGWIGRLGINGTAKAYADGFSEMIFAGIIVGLARSIYLVLNEGQIIDTIIYGLFSPVESLPASAAGLAMMVAQALLHIPVPSTSGQAVLTMPLLSPVADLTGMSRQVVVLAYQYGAGLMDLVTPSNGAIMAILAAAKISYNDWIRNAWKPILVLFGLGAVAIVCSVWYFH